LKHLDEIGELVKDLSRRGMLLGLAATLAMPGKPVQARAPDRSLLPQPRPLQRPAGTVAAAPVRAVQARPLEQLLTRANLGGVTGFAAIDATTGEVIEAHNADAPVPPASVAKAPTALYALHELGLEHRFITRIRAQGGGIEGGILRGDLMLEGGGDPVLQTEHLAALAQALVAQGLRSVAGRFLVDERALPMIASIDPGQVPQAGYSPAISGLNLNFNRVHFAWRQAGGRPQVSLDARSGTEIPPVSVIRIATAERGQPIYDHALRAGREEWTVAAPALTGEGSRWLPVRQPGLYAGDVLRALLAARGCTVPAPEPGHGGSGVVLAEHRSAPMTTLMREMLRFSTNIVAECAGLASSLRAGAGVRDLAASGRRMSDWLASRHGVADLRFADHSGLGDASRVTALGMARLFQSARREGMLRDILRDHPMRDAQGRDMTNHPVSVKAKTGTLNFVSGLGGYASTPGGREIAFAIFSADLPRRARIPEADRDRPPGGQEWARRARVMQQGLIERWAALHG
jgi:serine-type D-Ala-D-Ala carboxypeptidase/endopeptidase (penicillin-binding protein 4)